jgi:hypothetical protein
LTIADRHPVFQALVPALIDLRFPLLLIDVEPDAQIPAEPVPDTPAVGSDRVLTIDDSDRTSAIAVLSESVIGRTKGKPEAEAVWRKSGYG